jgi:hypothetical protein
MSALDTLPEQFDRLLEGIGTEYSLEELRFAFRKVLYSGAMKLYRDHPEIIVGPPPPPPRPAQPQQQQQPQQQPQQQRGGRGPHSDGQLPPYRPNAICEWVCTALGN